MYFSITFGKDAAGKFPVDFGAINRDGGERRLNVAVMRTDMKHVLQVLNFFRDDEFVALVTEYADGGDLQTHVESHGNGHGLAVREAKEIAESVATALHELHKHDIVHTRSQTEQCVAF